MVGRYTIAETGKWLQDCQTLAPEKAVISNTDSAELAKFRRANSTKLFSR